MDELSKLTKITGSGGSKGGAGGGGKGGGSGSTPKDDADSLKSKAYAEALWVLSEGPIQGFVDPDPLKSIYLDDTPLRSASGVDYFKNISLDFRLGSPDQTSMGFNQLKKEYPVGVTVRQGTPVTRTLVDPQARFVTVRIRIPSLFDGDNSKGEIKRTTLRFQIQISVGGAPFIPVLDKIYNDKTSSAFEESWLFYLPPTASNSWDIRVIRITPDSTNPKVQNDLVWAAYTSSQAYARTFPNTAVLGLRLDSESFSSIPSVGMDLYGRIVRTPHNYNPWARTYSGSFNGTLIPSWSDNPAWILYDLLTNDRFGAGISASEIDVYSFYSAAIYNDQLIPNLTGGTRPRYTFNAYITESFEAYDLINALCGSFRANLYWEGGKLVLTQDRPREPVRLYGSSNTVREISEDGVEGPAFQYDQTDLNTLYTACTVRWQNPALNYADDYEYLEDIAAIAKYGYRLAEIEAFGCTDRSLAHTTGEWYLYTSIHQDQVLSMKVGSEGMTLLPGEVARINNPARAGKDFSGRVADVLTANSILLDHEVTLEAGKNYSLSVLNLDGQAQVYQIDNLSPGVTQTIAVTRAFVQTPTIGTFWMLQANDLQGELFQLVKVVEEADDIYSLQLVNYNQSKFDYIERDQPLVELPTSNLPTGNPTTPSSLTISESYYDSPIGVKSKVQLLWSQAEPWVSNWSVEYRNSSVDAVFQVYGDQNAPYAELLDVAPGTYEIRIQAKSPSGLAKSGYLTSAFVVYGYTAPPSDLTGLSLTSESNHGRLSWDASPDLNVRKGGSVVIKHSPNPALASWTNSVLVSNVDGAATGITVPLVDGIYLAKFIDNQNRESQNATTVVTTGLYIASQNVVSTLTESPSFAGTKTGCTIVSNKLRLTDTSSGDTTGIYEFAQSLDLGTVQACRVTAAIEAANFSESADALWDAAKGLFDDRAGLFDGNQDPSEAFSELQISTSQDAITFTDWSRFQIGLYSARCFKFRLVLRSLKAGINISVANLAATIDMPDRTESGSFTGNGTVSFSKPFKQAPSAVAITLQNGLSGDYFTVTGITTTGFTINCFNSAGTSVSRTVQWLCKSY